MSSTLVRRIRKELADHGLVPARSRARAGSARYGRRGGAPPKRIAARIDHALLRADATEDDVARACDETLRYGFASVCVQPVWVEFAAARLRRRGRVCTVVGFPSGARPTSVKVVEAWGALQDGAHELDMVLQVGWLVGAVGPREIDADALRRVQRDIESVARVVRRRRRLLKVILETGALTDRQKVVGAMLAAAAGADFVKTSTGFFTGGATVADVRLLREAVGSGVGVKASGGVRTRGAALKLVAAGADRLGSSASLKLCRGERHA